MKNDIQIWSFIWSTIDVLSNDTTQILRKKTIAQ